ncbi:metallophosphoesterase [Staphylococcus massiliensis]|uniref:Calcineurin-like phosphoesterase domain-containing protein n=1 Tax=Staphylococcus massiliensis S46 TaxID=1229783 RepID=K9B5H0_9STAP|nr:metallophosphoesterase [Staphylococcus massiliensis]EKU50077.1 hypothetical protein C273_02373 [Staphylococcus massiliensis S46]PNZ99656.1 serine/threonine protein phosphatase [Staphylococcus massiliensis CCUG 55927]
MKQRVLVSSDIHGYGEKLLTLLEEAKYNPKKDKLVLVGDYVNNGKDSFGTLKIVKRLKKKGAVALLGNHEIKWMKSKDKKKAAWHTFLCSLPTMEKIGPYLFVHAGINKDKSLKKQSPLEVTGYKKKNIDTYYKGSLFMIHGHVPTYHYGCDKGDVHVTKHSLALDTGAGKGHYLSLVDLTNKKQYTVPVSKKNKVKATSIQIPTPAK